MEFKARYAHSAQGSWDLPKLARIMRITGILLLAACLQVSAIGYTQTVSLTKKNASLIAVFTEMQRQTGYNFLYTYELLDKAGSVDIDIRHASLEEALDICLADKPLTYSILEKTVVIKAKLPPSTQDPSAEPLPPIDVHGRITDSLGHPLPGVNILIRGSRKGTTTNDNGEFSLPGIPDNSVIVITSVGYESQEIKLKGKTDILIQLRIGVTSMQHIVINKGYYKTSELLNTGSVTRVDGADIAKQPITDPIVALEGRVPGLYITQTSGVPGANPIVRIRGQNSINQGNDPLYIVDGVPFPSNSITTNIGSGALGYGGTLNQGQGISPFSNLDPNNIESIEVLKDADATAIYGSRGANGVILITTKRGKAGKTITTINARQGESHIASRLHLMNTSQYLAMRRQALKNDGMLAGPSDYDVNGTTWDTTRYTDWQKLLIGGAAQSTLVNGEVSGGNQYTQFLLGGGYTRETTVFPGNYSDQHISSHFSLQHASINQKFHTSFSASYSHATSILPDADFAKNITLAPDAPPLYNPDGSFNWAPYPGAAATFFNPLTQTLMSDKSVIDDLNSNIDASYFILPGLQVKTSLSYSHMVQNQTNKVPAAAVFGPISPNNRINQFGSGYTDTWNFEPGIDYNRQFGKSKLEVQLGMSQQDMYSTSIGYLSYGFSSDALINNPSFATGVVLIGSSGDSRYRYVGLYAHIGYNWDEKYVLNLTGRRDGSSRFGPDNQFAKFGAVGAAWIFSKEKWTDRVLPWLSTGKLRASYGTTGNDQIGDFGFLGTYYAFFAPYNGLTPLIPSGIANPYYGWEVIKKMEASLDLGFFKDRLILSTSFYRHRSSNQLVYQPLSFITGTASILGNLPAVVQNTGLEVELTTINIRTKSFTWSSALNVSVPRNKLVAFTDLATNYNYSYGLIIGKSLQNRELYHYTGIDPKTGLYTFQDFNHDGIIDYINDAKVNKTQSQATFGGLDNKFTYKGLTLDVFFQFVKQLGTNYYYDFRQAGYFNINVPASLQNAWKQPGDHAIIQRYTTTGGAATAALNNLGQSDILYSDASFIRLKTLELSYRLPSSWLRKMRMQNCRMVLTGQNLLTITKYAGLDPENQTTNSLPPLRTLTAELQIGL